MENKGCKENKGCITCRKCEQVRINFYCGRTRLTQKQLYKPGFCSKYEPREQAKAKPMTNEEWFCGLPTKEKAKVIANATYSSAMMGAEITALPKEDEVRKWEMWLKQPHSEKE